MGLLSLMTVGGLTGCASSLAGRALVGPVNGEGKAASLENDSGVYRVIPVVVIGCDEAGDDQGEIFLLPENVGMSRDQAVVWVILRKKSVQRWTIYPEGIQTKHFNNGNPMLVKVAGNDAFFTDRPDLAGNCTNRKPCSWKYKLKVEVPQSEEDGTLIECAVLDPMIKIRR